METKVTQVNFISQPAAVFDNRWFTTATYNMDINTFIKEKGDEGELYVYKCDNNQVRGFVKTATNGVSVDEDLRVENTDLEMTIKIGNDTHTISNKLGKNDKRTHLPRLLKMFYDLITSLGLR